MATNQWHITPSPEEWLADVAHDLRHSLALLVGMVDQMTGNTPGLDSKILRPFHQHAEAMARKLEWLVELGRGAGHQQAPDWVQVDIRPLLEHMARVFQPLAESKGLNLVLSAAEEPCVCLVDAQMMESIFTNLLMNAVQHSPPNGTIELGWTAIEMQEEPWAAFFVRDEGPGIPLDQMPKIFNRYFSTQVRDPSSVGGGSRGRGVGLRISKDLTERLGGRMEVSNRKEAGTEFRVLLKRIVEAREGAAPKDEHEEPGIPQMDREQQLPLLLLIDDDEAYLRLLEKALKDEYSVVSASGGRRGLQLARELIPDVIICDVFMKDLDGFRVLHALRQDLLTCHIPTIMLSARVEMKMRIAGLEGGADAYLTKPVNMRELRVRLRKLLELRQLLQQHYNRVAGEAIDPDTDAISLPAHRNEDRSFLNKLRRIVEDHMSDESFNVEDFCRLAHLSYIQLYRKLKALADKTPSQFIRWVRLNKGRYLLKFTDKRVSEVAAEVGFTDPGYFTRVFREEFGLTPSALKA